ncbi:hypothetical protein ACZ87_03464 [Candidatus Erwinia dacicola]|uniref:Uncharacterized protein n=1 Tax=Candidatus Erwinia dacicola TaxID=252393 RepID=A0A328TKH4_9GAMM|nr:hypothetical protein ACZ87_03464 [Candidatus Erwinia dacicola]
MHFIKPPSVRNASLTDTIHLVAVSSQATGHCCKDLAMVN